MLHGCCGCSQLVFMRLTNYKNESETKHSYHAFIMQMCMMNIFVVCFLHASCSRLIQPVEVYINCYMMWYLKNICSAGNISFSPDASIFEQSVRCLFFGQSGRRPSTWPSSVIHLNVPHGTCSYVPCMLLYAR